MHLVINFTLLGRQFCKEFKNIWSMTKISEAFSTISLNPQKNSCKKI
jgi:hypothetical protein